jgi:hypothetical protein
MLSPKIEVVPAGFWFCRDVAADALRYQPHPKSLCRFPACWYRFDVDALFPADRLIANQPRQALFGPRIFALSFDLRIRLNFVLSTRRPEPVL